MIAKAWADSKGQASALKAPVQVVRGVEELFVQNDACSLCLLLNRRTKTMRIIDFRAGPSHAKRIFVLKLARQEGVEKVYTLVERDEVSTWMKLGFEKESNIPGFYKRSDAYILGCSVEGAEPMPRLAVIGEDEDMDALPAASAAHDRMEKTLAKAKRANKELLDRPLPVTKLSIVPETATSTKKLVERTLRAGRALTAFETFGRDVERRFFHVTGKAEFELVASTESQSCFGNAFLELLEGPSNEAERLATVSALRTLCAKLKSEGVVSCFSMCPSDDVALATAFVYNGFRRSGLLQNHVLVGKDRKDAIVFSRKLANPTQD